METHFTINQHLMPTLKQENEKFTTHLRKYFGFRPIDGVEQSGTSLLY